MRRYLIWLILFCSLLPIRAEAHKVSIFAYVEGDRVHTESYFVDGTPCANATIRVENSQGKRLLEGKTDVEGIFEFDLPVRETLHLVLDASMGHRAEYLLSSSEIEGQTVSQPVVSSPSIQEGLEQLLDRKLAPLIASVEALRRSQERIRWNDVIGGLGYIIGLMGLVMYFRSRKEKG